MNPAADKAELRRRFRRARLHLPRDTRRRAEAAVVRRLKPLVKRGCKIALYWPVGSEMSLLALVKTARQRGAQVYLPYIERGRLRLWFTPYRPNQTAERAKGRLKIPQFAGKRIRADKLHTLIIPVVAADRQGFRLGQGGGYYDATLARCPFAPRRIAAGFACQLADRLPHESHDRPLHAFVSERHYLRF
ncbi:5-formyltetrahydrofolate cyclo-ligase [Neisseria leonii]|uniref:5-formyltetrahydrofolate cyclo-ligase n=1 Tax=Neisseria leonii TaxID=2995413 RepID=UPI00237C02EB|nr:5-formyltetrahydrofolate cyclo-ligase [Neisseria sp. 3986]MDD9324876.1 5-formyltetrahydrofolate cyclo-ligase [Neisseria sp. 3986]